MKTTLMKPLFFGAIFMLLAACSIGQSSDEVAIKTLLNNQVKEWNHGNISAYMTGYWNNDKLIFVGKNGVRYGYTSTLENYKKNYPDSAAMGTLKFDLMELKRLSPNYYFVIGQWHLKRIAGNLDGHFSLVLKKIRNKWLIVADHSS